VDYKYKSTIDDCFKTSAFKTTNKISIREGNIQNARCRIAGDPDDCPPLRNLSNCGPQCDPQQKGVYELVLCENL
jgi:hypothetical protein